MHRSSFLALLLPFALLACAVETAPEEKEDTAAAKVADSKTETKGEVENAEAAQSSALQKDPVPFCLPGEKRVCTLFPVVCHCELTTTLPIEGIR